MGAGFTDNILLLAGIVLIFLVGREVMLWYYKINERLELQKETVRLLKKIAGEPEDPKEEHKTTTTEKKKINYYED